MAYVTVDDGNETFVFNVLNNHKQFSLSLWSYKNMELGKKWEHLDAFEISNIVRRDVVISEDVKQKALEQFCKEVAFN
ncbi:hypothetical protein [Photobacterium kishitanii]|uniref:Uncharacterized protein n=1 Tax=Photobacterium kishitanii TaxID=318456 RepID=A0A2T3KL93_9GAMM|nr:hypothetical protein [Photobacterium kishitanii]PSV00488.1 hypothetical protein C9J27_04970 [Photobacterium kishitanii]